MIQCGARMAVIGLAALAVPAIATPTDIVVRVISQGGKFVGTGMGGAEIVVRDARSGAILAKGVTAGTTGDTARIMRGGARGTAIADAGSAAFRTTFDVQEPRLIEIAAFGPLAQLQAAVRVTAQYWLVPGAPVVGDGWVLELPGLVVDVTEPAVHSRSAKGIATLHLAANVALMCGCPIEPGGQWDAARFDIRARVTRDARATEGTALSYAGTTGRFSGDVPISGSGTYVVTVAAVDRQTGATGVDKTSLIVP